MCWTQSGRQREIYMTCEYYYNTLVGGLGWFSDQSWGSSWRGLTSTQRMSTVWELTGTGCSGTLHGFLNSLDVLTSQRYRHQLAKRSHAFTLNYEHSKTNNQRHESTKYVYVDYCLSTFSTVPTNTIKNSLKTLDHPINNDNLPPFDNSVKSEQFLSNMLLQLSNSIWNNLL